MQRFIFYIFLHMVFIVGIIGCAPPQPEFEIGYQPPIPVPIKVSINSRGQIRVGYSGQIVTSIGTFDVSTSVNINSVRNEYVNKVLIVRVDDQAVVYELEEGKEFRLDFDDSNTLYKKVALKYESNGDIILELESIRDIPVAVPEEPDTPNTSGYWCDDLDGVRLSVGDRARIVWPKVNLRSTPVVPQDFYENIVAEVEEGTALTIIGGPECAHEGTWWEVRTQDGQTGWMREFISEGYLLR